MSRVGATLKPARITDGRSGPEGGLLMYAISRFGLAGIPTGIQPDRHPRDVSRVRLARKSITIATFAGERLNPSLLAIDRTVNQRKLATRVPKIGFSMLP